MNIVNSHRGKTRRLLLAPAIVLAVLLAFPGAVPFAEEPEKRKADEKSETVKSEKPKPEQTTPEEKKAGTVRVYTNADLPDATGSSPDPGAASQPARSPKAAKLDDPTVWMQKREREAATRTQRIAAAERAVQSARAKVANLQKQLLAVSNPYSARPELDDEEKEQRVPAKAETPTARKARTQKMLDDAHEQVRKAEQLLAEIRSGVH